MAASPKATTFKAQMLYVAIQALLLTGALIAGGSLSTLFWLLFAVVTLTKYFRLFRATRRNKRSSPQGR